MIENLGMIMIRKVEEAPFLNSSFLGLLELPDSLLVSSQINVRCDASNFRNFSDVFLSC